MFKSNVPLLIIFFVLITLKQLTFNDEIQWIDNIVMSVLLFLVYVFWEWAKKPYDWSKNDKKK